jgi:cobalt-zinc-cadmium efflux system outer membrane protein
MLYNSIRAVTLLVVSTVWSATAAAQDLTSLSLSRARSAARDSSPDLSAARAAVNAARARERQAGAFINPVVLYGREKTSGQGQSNSQDVVAVDQTIEAPGVRAARRDAAQSRTALAEARLRTAEDQLDFEVTRAYAQVLSANRRAALADEASRAFGAALTVSERRLKEGDISGFAARRIRLEAARYASLRAEATLARRSAQAQLSMLIASSLESLSFPTATMVDTGLVLSLTYSNDSLVRMALGARAELKAAALDVDVAAAEARLASRVRVPSVTLNAGTKTEEVAGAGRQNGFVAGLSLPVPLWDRGKANVEAAEFETRRRAAELAALRRRVAREVSEAADAMNAVQEQLRTLGPALQADAAIALRSAQLAYVEGELTLIEWLDTVRAYHETATSIANLRAELLIRAAALERAVGASLFPELR